MQGAYYRSNEAYEMSPARRRLVIAGLVVSGLLFLSGFAVTGYLWSLSRRFPTAPFEQPSRLYGAALRVAPGEPLSAADVVSELAASGYREAPGDAGTALPGRGTYRRDGDRVIAHLRRFPTPSGTAGGLVVDLSFQGGKVAGVRVSGRPQGEVALEPPLLASYYDDRVEERRPVSLDDVPDPVVKAVLAAEDSGFFTHPGVSPTGIARALWANVRGGEVAQGGSTITQQLVKNVYLSRRRTLTRKAKEAVIALAVELRYGKRAILEAYLNEIYLGRSGSANLVGLGAASRAYFGKDPGELNVAEAATLAGMIHAPADTSPIEHPEEARERRDWVLKRMAELGWLPQDRLQRALASPVETRPQTVAARGIAPYFADAAAAEARERFGVEKLDAAGYTLFSSLRRRDQEQAEAAVAAGLAGLERGWEKKRRSAKPLQAALISVDPHDGSVLAWVGGRDWGRSQFDRVSQARRQAGSAFKPVIYAAAFADGVATPATLFRDSPINVRIGRASWRPQNYDRAFHGWVTARTALEQSLNIPTVRLALQVGMPRVVDLAHDLGITGDLETVPAAALGTYEVSPVEMAAVYSTFASGGVRPSVHGLAAVLDPEGEAVTQDDLPQPRRVLAPQAAYVLTNILQGVVDHGTGAGAKGEGLSGPLAGKTGTTNDRRDSWFAGFSPDRVAVVWVGYDDNSPTQLSGARAALPIWGRFMAGVKPAKGYPDFPVPPGIVKVAVDPVTGQLATPYCPYQVTEIFAEWQAPMEPCQRHSPGYTGEAYADVTLGQPTIDPATGRPIDPSFTEEPEGTVTTTTTPDGLEIVQSGGPQAGAGSSPAGGSILIRPSARREPTPPEEQLSAIGMTRPSQTSRPARPAATEVGATGAPVGMRPAATAPAGGVVPSAGAGQAVGATAAPVAATEPAADAGEGPPPP